MNLSLPLSTYKPTCYFCKKPLSSQHSYKGVILCDKHDTLEVRKIIDIQTYNIYGDKE
jgi:hypothetical protein